MKQNMVDMYLLLKAPDLKGNMTSHTVSQRASPVAISRSNKAYTGQLQAEQLLWTAPVILEGENVHCWTLHLSVTISITYHYMKKTRCTGLCHYLSEEKGEYTFVLSCHIHLKKLVTMVTYGRGSGNLHTLAKTEGNFTIYLYIILIF